MKKAQDVIPANIIITKHVETDFPLQNFFQFIKRDDLHISYYILDGKIVFRNEIGLNYYLENEQGELIEWIGYTEIFPIKEIIDTKKRKEECVDVRRKKIIHVNSCNNQKINSLILANTCFTVYPMIKRNYIYKELKKEKSIYLVVYYVIPNNERTSEHSIIQSDKIKIIVK
jgi:hypothetical protein